MTYRLATAFGVLLLLFLAFHQPVTSTAESGSVYEVGDIKLNVRAEPSKQADVIGQLEKGNRVQIFEERYGWGKTYYGGEEAWIASYYVTPVTDSGEEIDANTLDEENSITVTAAGVHIRSGPGTNHSIIGFTSTGDTYSLIESAGDWHKVTLEDGSSGWIAGWLTDSDATKEAAIENNEEEVAAEDTTEAEETESQTAGVSTTNQSLSGYNIVIDPGHGGKDPGATAGDINEKDLAAQTADHVAEKLRNEGATVISTRSGDYYVSLDERVRISQDYNTHAFISLHYDAFSVIAVNGVSTYFHSSADRELAGAIQPSLSSELPLYNRGVMQGNYRVLRHNPAPSVILELGFMSNPNDLAVIQTEDYQRRVAEAVADGLKDYLN
ncbi:N-acetylmuramoyl-L-alanine amidase [Virgibacillus kimchii]